MPRSKGPQITVVCEVCGTEKQLPPSKAATFRFCSRECAADGRHFESWWGDFLQWISERDWIMGHATTPPGPDPLDRGRFHEGSYYVRNQSGWVRLEIEDTRIVGRVALEETEAS